MEDEFTFSNSDIELVGRILNRYSEYCRNRHGECVGCPRNPQCRSGTYFKIALVDYFKTQYNKQNPPEITTVKIGDSHECKIVEIQSEWKLSDVIKYLENIPGVCGIKATDEDIDIKEGVTQYRFLDFHFGKTSKRRQSEIRPTARGPQSRDRRKTPLFRLQLTGRGKRSRYME